MKNEKNNIFLTFSEKYGKMWKKVKNVEKGSDIDEKGQNRWKNAKIIFFRFGSETYAKMSKKLKKWWKWVRYWWKRSILMKNEKIKFCGFPSEKYRKMSQKLKNDENGSDIDGKGQNWWTMKTNNTFWIFFQKNMGKCRKKWKMMKMGQILMKKVKIDENEKNNIFWIF